MKAAAPQRGKSLIDFQTYSFFGGINIQDSEQELADTDLISAVNVYLSTEGDVLMRKGTTPANISGTRVGTPCGSLVQFYQNIVAGVSAPATFILRQCGGNLYNDVTGALIGSADQLGANAPPMATRRIFDPSRNGGTDVLIICTGINGPYAFDGTTLYTFTPSGASIVGARWVECVNDILYFGGIPAQPNVIVATAIGNPETTPGYAVFTVTYPVTGLGTLGVGLQTAVVVGMVQGLALLTGVTPLSYTEQEIPMEDGITSGLSMITIDGILYFVGQFAIYTYDGQTFREISRKVRPWILNDPLHQEYPMNGNRQAGWTLYWNKRIYFFYISNSINNVPNVALVYHTERGGWSIYAGQAFTGGCVLDAPTYPQPAACLMLDSATNESFNFDVFVDNNFDVSDNGVVINASFTTKFFKIGTPGTDKHLTRTSYELFGGAFNGLSTITPDYGSTISNQIIAFSPNGIGEWDADDWDQFDWASTGISYARPRLDWNIKGEAFSFGISTPSVIQAIPGVPANSYQIWRFMGVSGRVVQMPRS